MIGSVLIESGRLNDKLLNDGRKFIWCFRLVAQSCLRCQQANVFIALAWTSPFNIARRALELRNPVGHLATPLALLPQAIGLGYQLLEVQAALRLFYSTLQLLQDQDRMGDGSIAHHQG